MNIEKKAMNDEVKCIRFVWTSKKILQQMLLFIRTSVIIFAQYVVVPGYSENTWEYVSFYDMSFMVMYFCSKFRIIVWILFDFELMLMEACI